MSNPYRDALQEFHTAFMDKFFGNDTGLPPRLIKACNEAGEVLCRTAPPEPPDLTDEELLEIRDGAYCPGADEVNDEDDSMWQYTSNYTSWLYDQGTVEEQQQYEAKGLRAVFNAGRSRHP